MNLKERVINQRRINKENNKEYFNYQLLNKQEKEFIYQAKLLQKEINNYLDEQKQFINSFNEDIIKKLTNHIHCFIDLNKYTKEYYDFKTNFNCSNYLNNVIEKSFDFNQKMMANYFKEIHNKNHNISLTCQHNSIYHDDTFDFYLNYTYKLFDIEYQATYKYNDVEKHNKLTISLNQDKIIHYLTEQDISAIQNRDWLNEIFISLN